MPKSFENDYRAPSGEVDGQMTFDQLAHEQTEAAPTQEQEVVNIPVRRIPIETSQAIGRNNLEEAHAEIDRRDAGGYTSHRLIREAIGEPAATPEDTTRKESRRAAAHASKAHKPRTQKPYRARYKDTTDYVIRELKGDTQPQSNPDADLDEIFGADSAKRII